MTATVVVQPFEINRGFRSFFPLKTALNASVQEKSYRGISHFLRLIVNN